MQIKINTMDTHGEETVPLAPILKLTIHYGDNHFNFIIDIKSLLQWYQNFQIVSLNKCWGWIFLTFNFVLIYYVIFNLLSGISHTYFNHNRQAGESFGFVFSGTQAHRPVERPTVKLAVHPIGTIQLCSKYVKSTFQVFLSVWNNFRWTQVQRPGAPPIDKLVVNPLARSSWMGIA